jgi:hypothetical protein
VHVPASFTYLQMRPGWQSMAWKHAPPAPTAELVVQDDARIATGSAATSAKAKALLTPNTLRARLCPVNRTRQLREDDEDVAFVDRLAFRARDLFDFARAWRLDRHLHLHRLENDARLSLEDVVAFLHFDLPDRARDVRANVGGHDFLFRGAAAMGAKGEARVQCFTQAFASCEKGR